MNTVTIKAVMDWLRSTDLVSVRYHDGADGFELTLAQAAPPAFSFTSRYVPVCAPMVGLFQAAAPGQARRGEEGQTVQEGDVLGQVETGVGSPHAVKAPCSGRVSRAFISGGQPVHYGQPLFFLERG